jgi:hypothetical protein
MVYTAYCSIVMRTLEDNCVSPQRFPSIYLSRWTILPTSHQDHFVNTMGSDRKSIL